MVAYSRSLNIPRLSSSNPYKLAGYFVSGWASNTFLIGLNRGVVLTQVVGGMDKQEAQQRALREAEALLASLERRSLELAGGNESRSNGAIETELCNDAFGAALTLIGSMNDDDQRSWTTRLHEELLPPPSCAHCSMRVTSRSTAGRVDSGESNSGTRFHAETKTRKEESLCANTTGVRCQLGCNMIYCSAACRRAAFGTHQPKCPGMRRAAMVRDLDQNQAAEF